MAELLLFRVGAERFAVALASAEEAVEGLGAHPVPGSVPGMLGMAPLRGGMLPVYAAESVLGVAPAADAAVTLIVRGAEGRAGLLIDDVEDVIVTDLSALRPVPGARGADPVLRGVTPHGDDLVAVCDADALVHACLRGRA
jgi:purine-binding chemotaxis protein CheW